MADAIILQGHLTQAEFDANPTFVLGNGQIAWLKDDSGKFKKGDGVTSLNALTWLGGGSQNLEQVLIIGGNTGEFPIQSDNNFSYLYANNAFAGHEFDDDTVSGKMISDATQNEIKHSILNKFDAPNNNFPQETEDKIAVFDASKNLKSGTLSESDIQQKYEPLLTTVKLAENINKGQAVYISSANGTNIIVSKASNASEATSSKTLGLLLTTGATNDIVDVVTEGYLGTLNTSTATIGDAVWLGTSGNLIFGLARKPVAPAHLVYIGVVSRVHAVNGEILVKVQNGFELNEIHDVLTSSNVTTPVDTDNLLIKENSSGLWKSLSWLNLKATLKTYFDTLYGTIKGSVGATSGLIPYGTGVADTVTSSSDFSYISNNVQVTGNINGSVTMTARNNSTGNGAGAGFNAFNNAGKIAQFFKAGTGYSTYKTIKANDCGFYTDNGDFSFLNDGVGGAIQFTAGNDSIAHLLVKSNGDIAIAKNSFFGDTATTATAFGDFKAGTTSNASMRIRAGVIPTTQLDGEINYVGGRLKHYNGIDNTIAYVSEIQELALINALIFG